MENFPYNITEPTEVLASVVQDLENNFNPHDFGFIILTQTRYNNVNGLQEAFFASLDGEDFFKMTCEKVKKENVPTDQLENMFNSKNYF